MPDEPVERIGELPENPEELSKETAPMPPALPRWLVVAGLIIAIVGLTFLYRVDPAQAPVFPRCAFHGTTGLTCPGCGGCRSAHNLLRGRFVTAIHYNPFALLCLPIALYALLATASHSLLDRRWPMIDVRPWMVWTFFALLVVFWVVRNLPWYPFTLLVPPGM